jgi:hypothetical protein
VARLESDLAHTSGAGGSSTDGDATNTASSSLLDSNNNNNNNGSSSSSSSSTAKKNRNRMTGELELSELLGVDAGSIPAAVKARSSGTLAEARQAAESSGQMVNILQGQRDRYKEKLTQAENSISGLQSQLALAHAKTAQFEQDNLALYGKLRFLQSRGGVGIPANMSPQTLRISHTGSNSNGSSGSSSTWDRLGLEDDGDIEARGGNSSGGGGGGGDTSDGSAGNNVESKYSRLYESKMNPFAQFSAGERAARVGELSVGDQLVFTTLQQFMATPTRRNFMLIYMCVMHLLVLLGIYWMTHHTSHIHGCDPTLDHHVHKTLLQQQLD